MRNTTKKRRIKLNKEFSGILIYVTKQNIMNNMNSVNATPGEEVLSLKRLGVFSGNKAEV